MKLKELCLAMLAAALMLAVSLAFAHSVVVHGHYYNDDDDDDGEWKKRHRYGKGKKPKRSKNYRYYHYERPPVVIYRYPPVPDGVDRDPPLPSAGQKPSAKLQPSFPRESSGDRALAKERQREILEKELAIEQQLSAKAKEQLAQEARRFGAETSDSYVMGSLQLYKDNVETHEQNIQALRRELKNLAP